MRNWNAQRRLISSPRAAGITFSRNGRRNQRRGVEEGVRAVRLQPAKFGHSVLRARLVATRGIAEGRWGGEDSCFEQRRQRNLRRCSEGIRYVQNCRWRRNRGRRGLGGGAAATVNDIRPKTAVDRVEDRRAV